MSNIATLTTSWQSLGSASLYTGITIHLDGRYTSQSQQNNTSTIQFRLRSVGTAWRTTSGTAKFTGAYSDSKSCATYPDYINNNDVLITITKTVIHNTDGTKSVNIGGETTAYINGTQRKSTISNRSVTIPKINRLATILSATDFNDEGNPSITFDNPAGFTVKPYINFYDNNDNRVYRVERDAISNPYTWSITSTERTELRQAANQQQTYRAQIGVDTYNGSTWLGNSSVARTLTFVNAQPEQHTTFTETNNKIINLLGSSSAITIVKNASNLRLNTTPTMKKSATFVRVDYTNGSKTGYDTTIPCEWTVTPISNQFKIKVTDSRTFTMTDTYYRTMIDYEPIDILSVTFSRVSPTSSDIKLNAEIKYIQATFSSTPNAPTIKWKKGETGTLNTLSSGDYTIDTTNNKITITNLTLTNVISYQDEARFYFYVEDLLTQDEDSHNYVTKGIPTYDAGEHNFQINGDLFIADINRQNPIDVKEKIDWLSTQNVLWSGAWFMNQNQRIDLSDTLVSEQPNGIVLIWSAYENGQAKNWDWVCNFIPKKFVDIYGDGNGMTFNMITPAFNNVGAKYLYIANNAITGFSHNESTGTASGISYKNNYWVLRYVIGV